MAPTVWTCSKASAYREASQPTVQYGINYSGEGLSYLSIIWEPHFDGQCIYGHSILQSITSHCSLTPSFSSNTNLYHS